ncbi:MAG: hypothetical protein AB1715_13125, partial [Acidobacteriota bacterium]
MKSTQRVVIGTGGGFLAMENTAPKCIAKAACLVFFGVLATLICFSPALAQEQSPLPEKKASEYRGYVENGNRYLEQGKYREA